jgi:glucose-6-phosphate isomerase
MLLSIKRTGKDLSEVLYNPQAEGPDPVYVVFSGVNDGQWENQTIISNGLIGKEYPKTFGHYHPDGSPTEIYKVLNGSGAILLQKKFMEKGAWIENKVETVIVVKVEVDETVSILPNWGHSSSNLGKSPFITLDNWRSGHTPDDYKAIKELKGMAYYLSEENGSFVFVKNPNYIDLPQPLVMSALEFAKYQKENI